MAETDAQEQSDRADPAATRAPQGLVETALANCRPQPAIPAVLVLLLTGMFALLAGGSGLVSLLVPLGIVASCGLAIAAGFCSLFPQLAWIALAFWVMGSIERAGLPVFNRYLLLAGMLAAAVMLGVQAWRIATRRFVPTIPGGDDRGGPLRPARRAFTDFSTRCR